MFLPILIAAFVLGSVKAWLILSTIPHHVLFRWIKPFDIFMTIFVPGTALAAGMTIFLLMLLSSCWLCIVIHVAKYFAKE